MSVAVTGARELAADLDRLGRDLDRLDIARAGEEVRAELEALSPVRTGVLRSSWDVTAEGGRVSVGSDLVYAAVQNYGSSHVPALHFGERAAELTTDDAGRLAGIEIDRLISRM